MEAALFMVIPPLPVEEFSTPVCTTAFITRGPTMVFIVPEVFCGSSTQDLTEAMVQHFICGDFTEAFLARGFTLDFVITGSIQDFTANGSIPQNFSSLSLNKLFIGRICGDAKMHTTLQHQFLILVLSNQAFQIIASGLVTKRAEDGQHTATMPGSH